MVPVTVRMNNMAKIILCDFGPRLFERLDGRDKLVE